jgi:hypothetical protein
MSSSVFKLTFSKRFPNQNSVLITRLSHLSQLPSLFNFNNIKPIVFYDVGRLQFLKPPTSHLLVPNIFVSTLLRNTCHFCFLSNFEPTLHILQRMHCSEDIIFSVSHKQPTTVAACAQYLYGNMSLVRNRTFISITSTA